MLKPGLSPTFNPVSSQGMHRDYHRWYSHRLNRDMGVAVYGHYGMPILAFPTSGGDEWEQEGQGMIRTLGPYLEQGRIRIFSINGVNNDSFQNKGAHPFHRSWMQAQYDDYVASEVFPFIDSQCQTAGIPITTLGRIARRLSRRQHSLQASRSCEALLRALRRLRHARFHGRDVRRQLLLQ